MESSMIHVVTESNRDHYRDQLDEFHRLRHDIYVVERGWTGLRSVNGREYDQFDDGRSTYILSIEQDRVIGGARLRPTTLPHMLEQVCPQLAEVRGIPRGPDIIEWTRVFVIKERREGRYDGRAIGEIFTGVVEYCDWIGARQVQFVFETRWLQRFTEIGWKLRPLGLPDFIANDWWMAATFDVEPVLIDALRRYHRIDQEVLFDRGARDRALQVAS
jgi:acyl-homoserine lactone synthase